MAELTKEQESFFDETVETVNMTDLTVKVESVILSILRAAHSDSRKHQFRKRARSIQFPCPVCGDSKDDPTKMRGHIYLEYGLYKCYNNRGCASSLTDFLRSFDVADVFTSRELSELAKVAIASRAQVFSTRQSISLLEIEDVEPFLFDRDQIKSLYGACEINEDVYAKKKVAERQIPVWKYDNLLWVADWSRTKDDGTIERRSQELLILNMHNGTNKILNFQRRQMRMRFNGPKYMTEPFADICALAKIEQDEDIKKKMDIVGQFFNVLNIDWSLPVYVFEGPIDSFFMPNSLALGTSSVDLSHPTFHYLFDDDDTGRKEAMKRLDKHFPVFMWKKFLNENQVYRKQYVKKRDLNDMYKIKPFTHELIASYFTSNPLMKLNV